MNGGGGLVTQQLRYIEDFIQFTDFMYDSQLIWIELNNPNNFFTWSLQLQFLYVELTNFSS